MSTEAPPISEGNPAPDDDIPAAVAEMLGEKPTVGRPSCLRLIKGQRVFGVFAQAFAGGVLPQYIKTTRRILANPKSRHFELVYRHVSMVAGEIVTAIANPGEVAKKPETPLMPWDDDALAQFAGALVRGRDNDASLRAASTPVRN